MTTKYSRHAELFVSLVHNSSACIAIDGVLVAGYEQERLNRKKSSSDYPREAIDACLEATGLSGVEEAFVGHWFDDFNLDVSKYLDLSHLRMLTPTDKIVGLSPEMTHHDSHARSALAFARAHGYNEDLIVVTMDGFGNREECFSVHRARTRSHELTRVHRSYGYMSSLGLMYQYATLHLGLKMHQDEYKLLGYESRILQHYTLDRVLALADQVDKAATRHADQMLDCVNAIERAHYPSGLINTGALKDAQTRWHAVCHGWERLFDLGPESPQNVRRIVVAYCAQRFLEIATSHLLRRTVLAQPDHRDSILVLTGGSFLNVKLSRMMQRFTGMRVLCHPWAGDQGAAMGMAPAPLHISTLCIGDRDLAQVNPYGCPSEQWVKRCADLLMDGKIVNVVRGSMEYGPRALCNTSTLALPTRENVEQINALNERDDAMPMAPVMTEAAAYQWLDASELDGMCGSERYMITTAAFAGGKPPDRLAGVAHKDPLYDVWTARPQVTHDPDIVALLRCMPDEILINTSFNYHGEPIVYSVDNALATHSMQAFRALQCGLKQPELIVVKS